MRKGSQAGQQYGKPQGIETMASRFEKKADPAIKKNVRRSRAAAHKANNAHASVVAVSIAATIFAWGLFSNNDAQAIAAEQAANANRTAITVTAPAQSVNSARMNGIEVPIRLGHHPSILAVTR